MHQLQTVPQKEPDLPPDELAVVDDDTNQTPTNNTGKRLHLIPSSASSHAQTSQISPSKAIYPENAGGNAIETRGEDDFKNSLMSRGNDSSILEDSMGKDGLKISKSSSYKWDRNSKMPP